MEPDELQRQLQGEEILAAEIEIGDTLDPLEPLADRVGVHVEGAGAGGDAAPVGEELLQGLYQPGAAALVVGDQRLDRLVVAVTRGVLELEVNEVAIGAELLV